MSLSIIGLLVCLCGWVMFGFNVLTGQKNFLPLLFFVPAMVISLVGLVT